MKKAHKTTCITTATNNSTKKTFKKTFCLLEKNSHPTKHRQQIMFVFSSIPFQRWWNYQNNSTRQLKRFNRLFRHWTGCCQNCPLCTIQHILQNSAAATLNYISLWFLSFFTWYNLKIRKSKKELPLIW